MCDTRDGADGERTGSSVLLQNREQQEHKALFRLCSAHPRQRVPCNATGSRYHRLISRARHVVVSSIPIPWDLWCGTRRDSPGSCASPPAQQSTASHCRTVHGADTRDPWAALWPHQTTGKRGTFACAAFPSPSLSWLALSPAGCSTVAHCAPADCQIARQWPA